MLFHPNENPSAEDMARGDLRQFTGNGGKLLRVPGLKELTGLKLGNMTVPLSMIHKFKDMSDPEHSKISVDLPLIQYSTDSDGCPALMRAIFSNDGIWQAGMVINVYGVWDEEGDEVAAQKAATDEVNAAALEAHKQLMEEDFNRRLALKDEQIDKYKADIEAANKKK